MAINVLVNIPFDNKYTPHLKKCINHFIPEYEEIIMSTFFKGKEEKCIIRDIVSISGNISICRTFRVDGELSHIQRRIRDICNILDIKCETVDIDSKGHHNWLNITA